MDSLSACAKSTGMLAWIECHPGMAGWVQGLGTLIAVVIAIFVPLLIHWLEQIAAVQPIEKYNSDVRQALQDIREGILELLALGPRYFEKELAQADVHKASFRMLWPLTMYSSAVERLPSILDMRPLDSLAAMKAVDILSEALSIRKARVARAIRTLNMYNNSREIVRQEFLDLAEELKVVNSVVVETAKAFPISRERATMNLKRGLFRLWAVLTAAWILVAAYTFASPWREVSAPVTIRVNADATVVFPSNTPMAVAKNIIREHLSAGKKPDALIDALAQSYLDGIGYTPRSYGPVIWGALKLGLIPPIILFFLGVAVSWIISGFRSEKNDEDE